MIYNILVEQAGIFVPTGETVECEFEETQAVIDELQLEHGCCCALEAVSDLRSKRRQVCPQSPLLLKSFGDCGRII